MATLKWTLDRRGAAAAAALAVSMWLSGCAELGLGRSSDERPPLDETGNLLFQIAKAEDARDARDPLLGKLATADPDDAIRARAVLALGRVGDPASTDTLVAALGDTSPTVRREAVFALGLVRQPQAFAAVRDKALSHADPETRALAIGALARIGGAPEDLSVLIAIALKDAEPRVRGEAALAAWRAALKSPPPELLDRLKDPDAEVRWRTAYALGQLKFPGAAGALADTLRDEDSRARLFAARAIGDLEVLESKGDAAARAEAPQILAGRATLVSLLDDPEPQVQVEAALALGKFRDVSAATALIGAASHPAFQVRDAVLRALGGLDPDTTISDDEPRIRVKSVPVALLKDPSPTVRGEAVAVLPRVLGPSAMPRLLSLRETPDPLLRVRVAEAFAVLAPADADAARDLLRLAKDDPDGRVREAALNGLKPLKTPEARAALVAALESRDLSLVGTAATVLGEQGDATARDALIAAYHASQGVFELTEARADILEAMDKLGDGPEAKAILAEGLRDPEPMVRTKAAELIAKAAAPGASPPAVSQAPSRLAPEEALRFEAEIHLSPPVPIVRVHTEKGDIVMRLLPEEAPVIVESFLRRASRGFYNGLTFHRVVSNWVIQGGDPRGDGWGGGDDRFLRDQFTRRPFRRGSVGVPTSGKDTGGCQVFVCLVPAPNLDGRYTQFAEVIGGLDVADRIEIGDRIVSVELVPVAASAAAAQ